MENLAVQEGKMQLYPQLALTLSSAARTVGGLGV